MRKENKEIESYPFCSHSGSSLSLSSHVHLFALINPCWSSFTSSVNSCWIRIFLFSILVGLLLLLPSIVAGLGFSYSSLVSQQSCCCLIRFLSPSVAPPYFRYPFPFIMLFSSNLWLRKDKIVHLQCF